MSFGRDPLFLHPPFRHWVSFGLGGIPLSPSLDELQDSPSDGAQRKVGQALAEGAEGARLRAGPACGEGLGARFRSVNAARLGFLV